MLHVNDELKAKVLYRQVAALEEKLREALDDNKRLRAGLRQFADHHNWDPWGSPIFDTYSDWEGEELAQAILDGKRIEDGPGYRFK